MTPPLSKTKFVRPLCEINNSANVYANLTSPIQPVTKNANFPEMHSVGENLKHMDEMRSKQLNNLNSVHSKLFAEVEEIQKWKTAIEMESMQKNKKVEELLKTIETQRKVVLDLQLQIENLNYRLSEEVQQRSFVFEKFHSTKELSSALKKHFNALQKQFDYRNTIEEMIQMAETKRMRAIEVLENKYEKICIEHSERIGYLNDALATETNKSLNLKEALEREVSLYENEKQSLCTLLNNSQLESERLSKDLEEEISKSRNLLQEKQWKRKNRGTRCCLPPYRTLKMINNDFNDLKENVSQLLEEKTELNLILENTKNELSKCKSDYENTLKLYEEKNEEILKVKEEYEAKMCLKDKEIISSREDNKELLLKYKSLEEDGFAKSELVITKDKEVEKLQALLEENKKALESLKNDNAELKENYEQEKTTAKVCLECETLKAQISEFETIKACLKKTEEELSQQIRNTNDIKKLLYESEKISNEDRISKQKEIIQYKNQMKKLENEIVLKYVEREMFNVLNSENEKLKKDLEEKEAKLQKVECLNASLEKKAVKVNKSPKEVMMVQSPKPTMIAKSPKTLVADMYPKQAVVDKSSKQAAVDKSFKQAVVDKSFKQALLDVSSKQTKAGKSPKLAMMIAAKVQNRKVKEKDSNLTTSENNRSKKSVSSNYELEYSKPEEQDFCFEKKVSNKENKAWDADSSSGSEYLDISLFQKPEAETITQKEGPKVQDNFKNKLINKFLSTAQQKRESQETTSDNNMAKRLCMPHKTETQFKSSIWTQALKTPEKTYQDIQVAEQTRMNKRNTPLTPTITTPRKFFKTPLLARDNKFKKPREPWI